MDRLKTTLFTALVIAILVTPAAAAQATAANVAVISGNGQMICTGCSGKIFTYFYPMVVKVTDASGNPIAGKTVNWSLITVNGGIVPAFDTPTVTDSNGLSVSRLFTGVITGSPSFPFAQSTISATADSVSTTFTETQALTTSFSSDRKSVV